MGRISRQYLESLPEIYRDILSTFPKLVPSRKAGYGLAFQTLYGELENKYSMGEIIEACRQMEAAGAVEIKQGIFVHPKEIGEEIITGLTGCSASPVVVPAFPVPNGD